jgi:hypothetical protein
MSVAIRLDLIVGQKIRANPACSIGGSLEIQKARFEHRFGRNEARNLYKKDSELPGMLAVTAWTR